MLDTSPRRGNSKYGCRTPFGLKFKASKRAPAEPALRVIERRTILYATGLKAAEVFGYIENFDAEVDTNSASSIKFRNGAIGTISVVGNCPRWYEDITVVGEEGVLLVRGGELVWNNRKEVHKISDFRCGSTSADQNFINAILGKEEVLAPPLCGLRTIEITEAIWKSAESGKPVKVKEQDV